MQRMERTWQQRVDRIPPEFILARTYITARLVKRHNRHLARCHPATIHLDVIVRLNASGQLGASAAINLDAARLNQCVTGAAGSNGTGGEVFVESGSVVHRGEA